MATYISYDDKREKLLSLPIGKVRELLAYADGDETLDDWLDDIIPALLDSEWNEDYQEEDEEEEDWVEGQDNEDGCEELANPEEEQLAQDIAGDIAWGKYALSDIPANVYSQEVMDRIKYLI